MPKFKNVVFSRFSGIPHWSKSKSKKCFLHDLCKILRRVRITIGRGVPDAPQKSLRDLKFDFLHPPIRKALAAAQHAVSLHWDVRSARDKDQNRLSGGGRPHIMSVRAKKTGHFGQFRTRNGVFLQNTLSPCANCELALL
jgi:hypothetical protein